MHSAHDMGLLVIGNIRLRKMRGKAVFPKRIRTKRTGKKAALVGEFVRDDAVRSRNSERLKPHRAPQHPESAQQTARPIREYSHAWP